MENDFDFDLEDQENFTINPEVWLHTLLAIAGDREKKAEAVRILSQKASISPAQANGIMTATITILINQIRAN